MTNNFSNKYENNNNIENIIFDLGNVLLNIDESRRQKAMRELGFKNFRHSYEVLKQKDIFDLLERGHIHPDEFYGELNSQLAEKRSHDEIEAAWSALILDIPELRLELLEKLSKKYRLFLLSNTDKIHFNRYNTDLKNKSGKELSGFFEKCYYSFELGIRKPDREIFEHALSDSKLKPKATLFIDDLKQNIQSAAKLGLHTLWIDISSGDEVSEKLVDF